MADANDTQPSHLAPQRYVFDSEDSDILCVARISDHYFILTTTGIYVVASSSVHAVVMAVGCDADTPVISFHGADDANRIEYIPYKNATYIQYCRTSDTLDIVYDCGRRAVSVDTSYTESSAADGGTQNMLKEYRPSYDIPPRFANAQFLRVWNDSGVYIAVSPSKKQVVFHDCDHADRMRIYYMDDDNPNVKYDTYTNFVWCEEHRAVLGVFHITAKAQSGWCVVLFLEHNAAPIVSNFIFTLDYPMTSVPWVSFAGGSDDILYVFCANKRPGATTDVIENGICLTSFLRNSVRNYDPPFARRVRIEDDADLVNLSIRDILGRVRTVPANVSSSFRFLKPPPKAPKAPTTEKTLSPISPDPLMNETHVQSSSYIHYLKWIVENYGNICSEYVRFYDKESYTIPIYNSRTSMTVDFNRFYGADTTEPSQYIFQKLSLMTGCVYERVYELSYMPDRIVEKYVVGVNPVSSVKIRRLNRIIVALGYPIARDHFVYNTPYMYFRFRADAIHARPKAYWERAYGLLNSAEGVELLPWLFINLFMPPC